MAGKCEPRPSLQGERPLTGLVWVGQVTQPKLTLSLMVGSPLEGEGRKGHFSQQREQYVHKPRDDQKCGFSK